MIKKIDLGKTNLADLYHVFKFVSNEEFEKKKTKLFPCGNTENEISTTSIFLASLSAVKEYREELFTTIGVNKIKNRNVNLHAYTELSDSKTGDRPDGLIVITSGIHNPIIEWAGFVETKVGDNEINENQIDKYASFSREIGINDIITISNYLVTNPMQSPIKLNKRSFNLYHWSWSYLKVTASYLIRTKSIEDEDHIYILGELRRYFDSHGKLSNFTHMGNEWKDSVNKINSFSPDQKIEKILINNIIKSYAQEEKDISLQLTDKSNYNIELLAKENRAEEIERMLQTSKNVTSTFMLNNDRKNTFNIDVDFIRREIRCTTQIIINRGKAQAQTSALIKLFEEESGYTDNILINAIYIRNKCKNNDVALSTLIEEKNNSEYYSILEKSYGDEVRYFEIKTKDLLGKDFQSVKSFIIKLEGIAFRFLTQVMVNK
ncbi:MAG: hypothetical protein PF485_10705 [Bacteroidales bacterium]|jgi:DNA-binding CsgD family transcriptional regulator|nr:hypothetical protein [Bacteroidales bacterium]